MSDNKQSLADAVATGDKAVDELLIAAIDAMGGRDGLSRMEQVPDGYACTRYGWKTGTLSVTMVVAVDQPELGLIAGSDERRDERIAAFQNLTGIQTARFYAGLIGAWLIARGGGKKAAPRIRGGISA